MSKLITLQLPYPPTVNNYWDKKAIQKGHRWIVMVYPSKAAKEFHAEVARLIYERFGPPKSIRREVIVEIVMVRPDLRKRDTDNIAKATFDALTYAGFWRDDSQVYEHKITRGPVCKPGWLEVRVKPAEQHHQLEFRDLAFASF